MSVLNDVINFLVTHQGVLATASVAVLDLVFALNKKLEGNGILHSLYVLATSKVGKPES